MIPDRVLNCVLMKLLGSKKFAITNTVVPYPNHGPSTCKGGKFRPGINGISVILPLTSKPVHALETKYHCMQITKNTIAYCFLQPQSNTNGCKQTVCVLTKGIKI